MNYLSVLKNAAIFGLMTLIVGLLVMYTLKQTPLKQACPNKCDRQIWDKYFIREISLFLTGFVDVSVVILLQKFQPIFAILLSAIKVV